MGKEYIERDQAIRAVCDCRPHSCDFETDCAMGCQDVQALIKIPAADVVPVVRCGECKYWEESSAIPNIGTCVFTPIRHTAKFFCANGEQKDGDGE